MAQETYTLDQVELDLATLRGQVDLLSERLTLNGYAGPPNTPAGGAVLWADALGNVERLLPSGHTAQLTDGQADVTVRGPFSSNNDVTISWAIPAGDWQVTTAWRLTAWGIGTQAGTPTTLLFAADLGGSASYAQAGPSGTGFAAGGAAFKWRAEVIVQCVTTGVSGTANASVTGFTFSGTTGTTLVGEQTAIALNTTAATTLAVRATFGAAASITGHGSTFERIGA